MTTPAPARLGRNMMRMTMRERPVSGVCGAAPEFASFRNPEISKHNSGPRALEISLGFRDFKIRITVPRFHDFVEIWESFNACRTFEGARISRFQD